MSKNEILEEHLGELKERLQRIERELPEMTLPALLMDDFRRALDHLRHTVWALSTARGKHPQDVYAAITQYRVQRTAEMCERIVGDIASQRIAANTPDVIKLNNVLNELHVSIRELFSPAAADGRLGDPDKHF
jgi:hypothetical protein